MISLAVRILFSVHSWTVRYILADRPPLNFHTAARLKLPLANTAQHRRTVRSVFLRLRTSLQSLCWTSPMNGGLSASYPRTVRTTKFQTAQNFSNFTILTLNWDHCSYKIPKNLTTSMNTIQRLIWVSKNKNSKIIRVKSRKLINTP